MIRCQQYDYIEIACLFHIYIQLTLNNGETVCGIAQTTNYNEAREECLLLKPKAIDSVMSITVRLNQVSSMQALEENPHFSLIHFD